MMDPFGDEKPLKKPTTHEIGQELSTLSVHELDERIALLEAEIVRLHKARTAKEASRHSAESVFKSRP